MQGKEMATY